MCPTGHAVAPGSGDGTHSQSPALSPQTWVWPLGTTSLPHGQVSWGDFPGVRSGGHVSVAWLSHAPPTPAEAQAALETPLGFCPPQVTCQTRGSQANGHLPAQAPSQPPENHLTYHDRRSWLRARFGAMSLGAQECVASAVLDQLRCPLWSLSPHTCDARQL